MRTTILLLLLSLSFAANAQLAPRKAVIYAGVGACEDGCVEGAIEAAKQAGLEPVTVTPATFKASILDDAAVWIQPGGKAKGAANAMGGKMMSAISTFVKNGGGYVGFCAGAFIATYKIGTSWFAKGLGIFPGQTILYRAAPGAISMEKMEWKSLRGTESREIYWEGGPYLSLSTSESKNVTVIAKYNKTKQISSARAPYGKGRVFVTGAHPEAPQWWRDDVRLGDQDGLDYDLTTEQIQWAARITP